MAKFNFKKWIIENKHGLLNEQINFSNEILGFNVDTCNCNQYDESTNTCSWYNISFKRM